MKAILYFWTISHKESSYVIRSGIIKMNNADKNDVKLILFLYKIMKNTIFCRILNKVGYDLVRYAL